MDLYDSSHKWGKSHKALLSDLMFSWGWASPSLQVLVAESLPRTATNKVMRRMLRSQLMQQHKLWPNRQQAICKLYHYVMHRNCMKESLEFWTDVSVLDSFDELIDILRHCLDDSLSLTSLPWFQLLYCFSKAISRSQGLLVHRSSLVINGAYFLTFGPIWCQ